MIQATSINSTPIKPPISFGQNQKAEDLKAAASWIKGVNDEGFTEDKFNDLQGFSEKMSDGPFKTFAKIFGIAGAACVAIKLGANKAIKAVSSNQTVRQSVIKPLSTHVDKGLRYLSETAAKSAEALKKEKGVKPFIAKYSNKAMEWVNTYAKRGTEGAFEAIEKEIKAVESYVKTSISSAAKKKGEKITEKQLAKLVQEKLAGDSKKAIEYKELLQKKSFLSTENLLTKTAGNGAGAIAGTTAAIEANKDRDGDGIADIGQHDAA